MLIIVTLGIDYRFDLNEFAFTHFQFECAGDIEQMPGLALLNFKGMVDGAGGKGRIV